MTDVTRREFIKKSIKTIAAASIVSPFSGCGQSGRNDTSPLHSVYISSAGTEYSEERYDFLKNIVGKMIETLYSARPFFAYGDKVSIKINIVSTLQCLRMGAELTYIPHPMVARAMGEVLKDLGAGDMYFIEGSTVPSDTLAAFSFLGYDKVAAGLGATPIDLNLPYPYEDFIEIEIPNGLSRNSIMVNRHIVETDCIISLAKLKCHSSAGISLSLKNLIGIMPMQIYGAGASGSRTEYVHAPDAKTSIPYTIIDMARVAPIRLSFLDGISAIDKGEGPWAKDISLVKPGLLIAGDNPVAADSIGMKAMGLNPEAEYPDSPFVSCVNHISLAAKHGLGSHFERDIKVLGQSIQDSVCPYNPPGLSASSVHSVPSTPPVATGLKKPL